MKIILEDSEFQKMASAWVFENLVEKILVNANVVNNVIELDVVGEGENPEREVDLLPAENGIDVESLGESGEG
jgi:hypothetical protein